MADKKIFLVTEKSMIELESIGDIEIDEEQGYNVDDVLKEWVELTPELEEKIANKIFIDLGGNAYPIARATIQKLKEEIL